MSNLLNALSAELVEAVEQAGKFAAAVDAGRAFSSSGIVWKPGVIVTAAHTLGRREEIAVTLPDGSSTQAELVGRDTGTDLAVLRCAAAAETSPFTTVTDLKPGTMVLSVGRTREGTMASMGIVSTSEGPRRTRTGGTLETFVRLDLAAYPQTSGSALVDTEGRLAGIVTTGLSRIAPVLIPVATIERVSGELLQRGHIARGYLGIGLQPIPLPHALQEKLGRAQASAIIILSVEPKGPAEQAGLVIGDVLASLDGKPLADTDDLQTALDHAAPGTQVALTILRAGHTHDVAATVGERARS